MKTEFTKVYEFVHLYESAITSLEDVNLLTGFHEDIIAGRPPSEDTVNWIKELSMTMIGNYKKTAMEGIPFMEDDENYQLELDLGSMEPSQLYLHNNENQIHHLVHVLFLLTDEDVTLALPSQGVDIKLNKYRVLIHPANFSYRYKLTSDSNTIPFVRGALAFQS